MASLQLTAQAAETTALLATGHAMSSVNGARSLGAELMELFVRKQPEEVSGGVGRLLQCVRN